MLKVKTSDTYYTSELCNTKVLALIDYMNENSNDIFNVQININSYVKVMVYALYTHFL